MSAPITIMPLSFTLPENGILKRSSGSASLSTHLSTSNRSSYDRNTNLPTRKNPLCKNQVKCKLLYSVFQMIWEPPGLRFRRAIFATNM